MGKADMIGSDHFVGTFHAPDVLLGSELDSGWTNDLTVTDNWLCKGKTLYRIEPAGAAINPTGSLFMDSTTQGQKRDLERVSI